MRRHYFNNSETGYFKQERPSAPNALSAMGGLYIKMATSIMFNAVHKVTVIGIFFVCRSIYGARHDEEYIH